MADNIAVTAGTGTTVRTNEISSVHHPYVKVEYGADGSATPVSTTNPLPITQATLLAGEDLTNNVIKVEERFSYAYLVADGQVKAGAGFLHTVTISPIDAAATAGTIFVYDALTETTPTIFAYTVPAAALVPVTVILDVSFATGLYVGFTTTADVSVTVSYR